MRRIFTAVFLVFSLASGAAVPDSLLYLYKESITQPIDDKRKADLYNDLFKAYLDEHVDSALHFGKLAEEHCKRIGYEKGLASYYNNQGIYNKNIGNYYTSLLWYHKYLELAEKLNDKKSIASAFNNIGIVYKMQENRKLALDYLNKSLQIKRENGLDKEIASTLNNIGNVYVNNAQWDSALYYYYQASDLNTRFGNKKFLCVNMRNMAEAYLNKQEFDSARYYIGEAGKLMLQIAPDNKQVCEWYNLLGMYYQKTERYALALVYADSAEKLVRKSNFKNELLDLYKLYAELYKAAGNYSQAYLYERDYNRLRDSVYKESISVQVSDLQQSYEMKKLDSNLETLKQQKFFLIIIALLIAALLVATTYYLRKRKHTIELLDNKNHELRKLNEEKNDLIRLVAHDLKSPLSRTHMLAQLILQDAQLNAEDKEQFVQMISDSSRETLDMINKFLALERSDAIDFNLNIETIELKNFLDEKVKRFLPLARDKQITLRSNIALQQTRLNTDLQCLRQILANLISNAIKYTEPGGEVTVNLMDDENQCIFEVHDSGPGIPEEAQKTLFTRMGMLINKPTGGESSSGFGLFIVKKLVDRLGGDVWVKSTVGVGTSFFVSLRKK